MSSLKRIQGKRLHQLYKYLTNTGTLLFLLTFIVLLFIGQSKHDLYVRESLNDFSKQLKDGQQINPGVEPVYNKDVDVASLVWPYTVMNDVSHTRIGNGGQGKYLVVGIPTVSRGANSYLNETLQSILDNVDEMETKNVLLVVYVGDVNNTIATTTVDQIVGSFSKAINSGLLEVIRAPDISAYPTLTNLKQNYGDSPDRVYWRSKQCLDFSLLMSYCQGKGEYYMQLEDDVITVPDWVSEVRRAINKLEEQQRSWYMIDFSVLGFIGKTFHSSNMGEMIQSFSKYYVEAPVDIILAQILTKPDNKRITSRRSLFQHIGYYSSLDGKVQALKDPIFDAIIEDDNVKEE